MCPPPRRARGRTNPNDLVFDGLRGLFLSLPMKKKVKPILVISVVFVVALGL
mgnify:CR=1 FL=1